MEPPCTAKGCTKKGDGLQISAGECTTASKCMLQGKSDLALVCVWGGEGGGSIEPPKTAEGGRVWEKGSIDRDHHFP